MDSSSRVASAGASNDLSTPCYGFLVRRGSSKGGGGGSSHLSTPCYGFDPYELEKEEYLEIYLSTPCYGFPRTV